MNGNVWEWTRSLYESYPYPPPGRRRQQREGSKASGPRVLRGGAYSGGASLVRCAVRYGDDPTGRHWGLGFRVVLLPFSSDL
jgi:formylglycine-generating enzyme required for sulfatase activity